MLAMNAEAQFYFILIIVITLTLFALPFIPAWLEWKNKTDAEPFVVNFPDRTVVDFSIRIFKEYIEANFASLIEKFKALEASEDGKLANGTEYLITGKSGPLELSSSEIEKKKTNKVYIICKNGTLPPDMDFENKIYACESLNTGPSNSITELMAEGNVLLQHDTIVKKLVKSGASIFVHKDCKLGNYLRAKNKILFLGNAQFQYLYAPSVEFGEIICQPKEEAIDVFGSEIPRVLIFEGIEIAAGSKITSNFIIKKPMHIRENCTIFGNIKCYDFISIGKNTSITGAIICEGDIYIDENCDIQGPIVSTGTISIGNNCRIGVRSTMTSIIAQDMFITKGCFIGGLVLAKGRGNYWGV